MSLSLSRSFHHPAQLLTLRHRILSDGDVSVINTDVLEVKEANKENLRNNIRRKKIVFTTDSFRAPVACSTYFVIPIINKFIYNLVAFAKECETLILYIRSYT